MAEYTAYIMFNSPSYTKFDDISGTYRHDLKIVDLALALAPQHHATFITEREIRQQKGLHGVGQEGHICDGILLFDNKKVAIEVELTAKGKSRLQKIINNYIAQLSYKEIWYFCGSDGIANLIEKYANKAPFIKVRLLEDALNPKETQNDRPSKIPVSA